VTTALLVFGAVYIGMFLGRWPRLQLDRTGIALLGALVLLVTGAVTLEDAAGMVDMPTLALLFGLMVMSAQLRLGGFYHAVTGRIAAMPVAPARLLAILMSAVGALAAVFTNDVVCLAVTPVALDACARRRLDPVPFLIGVALAANIGSGATLIGNPQNMLIGQMLGLSFGGYLVIAAAPVLLGLAAAWAILVRMQHGQWTLDDAPTAGPDGSEPAARDAPTPLDRWQTAKGLLAAGALLFAFLFTDWPHELVALAGAAALMTSRKLHSREMLGLVDWQLLVLFAGLFVVNGALQQTGAPADVVRALRDAGADLEHPGVLFGAIVILSNLVSNVPAVMLLLPVATHPAAGPVLALAGTLAGNLILVGSIANLIVADVAGRHGVRIDWRTHARYGVPVTLATLAIAAAWLVLLRSQIG
jgi:Na+/H+ antiporter NhaD/arsenite permease-like protein